MSDQHKEWEDDGRTIADMSGQNRAVCWLTYTNAATHAVIRANLDRSPLFGHKEGASRKKRQEPSDGDYVPPLSRGDRWAFLLGTMKASLLIALAFLGGLGLCIWLLTLLLH